MLDIRNINRQITFRGAANVAPIADKQKGPTCGFEAIENIIQLFHNVGNNLVEVDLLRRAKSYGALISTPEGPSLDIRGYSRMLQDYGIPSHWYPFDYRQIVIPALWNNRGLLVVGDAHYLNSEAYPKIGSNHAFVLTNYYTEESEHYILGYIGVDSNFAQTEIAWPYQNIENAVQWATQNVITTPVLITDIPINWQSKVKYYKMTKMGQIVPIY
jgi:hypothetical protein